MYDRSDHICKDSYARSGVGKKKQGRSQDFSKGGSQRLLTRSPSGDRRLYMVYTAAFPRVSVGSVVLLRH